jgi:hypothetical protein
MKFLLIVLTVHFAAEMIGNKRKEKNENKAGNENKKVRHPAEFDIR